jgi:flavin-dependent dehydrogenase
VLGVGSTEKNFAHISESMNILKHRLSTDFAFKPFFLKKKESWAIPYGFVLPGKRNVILVGDAAGFCNVFSGEGIRFAIESAEASAMAVKKALINKKLLAPIYANLTKGLMNFVQGVYRFKNSLKEKDKEDFVKSELLRRPFF